MVPSVFLVPDLDDQKFSDPVQDAALIIKIYPSYEIVRSFSVFLEKKQSFNFNHGVAVVS